MGTLVALLPTVAAACHTEPPDQQLQCLLNDLEHAKEAYADGITGEAATAAGGATRCHGEWVAWTDWNAGHDATCGGFEHRVRTTHHAEGGQLGPATGGLVQQAPRVVLGELKLDGHLVARCIPAADGNLSSCSIEIQVFASDARCLTVEAVSHLNTGTMQTAAVDGPWTTC